MSCGEGRAHPVLQKGSLRGSHGAVEFKSNVAK